MADFEWLRPGGHAALVEGAKTYAREVAADANNNVQKLAKTLTGTIVTASDAYAAPPVSATVYGQSTQGGTPTPSAPVPIESVDALTLYTAGRNLIHSTTDRNGTTNGITRIYRASDNLLSVHGTATSNNQDVSVALDRPIYVPTGETLTFSVGGGSISTAGGFNCFAIVGTGYPEYHALNAANNYAITFTDLGGMVVRGFLIRFNISTGATDIEAHPQAQLGSVATDYEPYVGTSTSIDLQGHELRSLPDGTRDELTLTPDGTEYRVTLTQRVGRVDIGAFTWVPTSAVGSEHFRFTYRLSTLAIGAKLLCSSLTPVTYAEVYNHVIDNSIAAHPNVAQLEVYASGYTDATAFKQAMSGATLHYALATPVTIDLGTVTLPALPAPDVIVWADGSSATPSLAVTYERDASIAESVIHADVDDLRTDVGGLLTGIAQIPSMLATQFTAGASGGITGGGPTDSAAWTERVTGGGDASDGPATIDAIRGRTVVWNQHAPAVDDESWNAASSTIVADATVHSITVTSTTDSSAVKRAGARYSAAAGHKYLLAANVDTSGITAGGNASFGFNNASSNAGTITIAAGSKERISGIVTASESTVIVARIPSTTASGESATFADMLCFDLTLMFGAGNEPSTVAEFERMFPEPYYLYDAGSLLSVNMTGVESVGFNQWNEQWEVGNIAAATGEDSEGSNRIRSKGHIPVLPGKAYYITSFELVFFYDSAMSYLGYHNIASGLEFTTPSNASYVRFRSSTAYGATYKHDICFNISDPTRNGEYEPYWKSERGIPAATYFPQGMRSAGSVYDELTADAAVTRVGSVDLGTLTWTYSTTYEMMYATISDAAAGVRLTDSLTCDGYASYPSDTVANLQANMPNKSLSLQATYNNLYVKDSAYTDAAAFKTAVSGVTLHYALATPTTTPIDPPLNLTYKAATGGTERIAHTDPTAPPTLVVTYGSTADSIRDRVLSAIAPVENGRASANYVVGSYLIHDGTLCKVTTAIALGEVVTIGTNVTATTVMVEVIALTQ